MLLIDPAGPALPSCAAKPAVTCSERELEAGRQRDACRHLRHLFGRHLIGLGARIVERGGDMVFQHLLVLGLQQPRLSPPPDEPPLRRSTDLHKPPPPTPFTF